MKRSVCLAALAATTLAAMPAWAQLAQPPPGPPAAQPAPAAPPAPANPVAGQAAMEEARRHFRQGMVLYDERDYNGALAEFETAYRQSREPVALYQMGLTLRALFRYQEAIETLTRYLSHTAMDTRVTAEQRRTVEGLVAEMRSLMADITVRTTPPNATVKVNGRETARDVRGVLQLAAGDHEIEASAPDFMPESKRIRVVAGVAQALDFQLKVIPRDGVVEIRATRPGVMVRVDGVDKGTAPQRLTLPAGGHLIEGVADGFRPWRTDVNVVAGQTRQIEIHLEPQPVGEGRPFYKTWWFWTATGVGLAAAGGATALALRKPEDPLRGTLSPGVQPVPQ